MIFWVPKELRRAARRGAKHRKTTLTATVEEAFRALGAAAPGIIRKSSPA